MDAMSVMLPIILLAIPIGVIVLMVWMMRRGQMAFDVRQVYLYLVALCALLFFFIATFVLAGRVFVLVFSDSSVPSDSFMRQQIAEALGMILVASPAWWLHWHEARRRAFAMKRLLALRIYLYTIAVFALVVAVIVGGVAVSEILKGWFGLVDFSNLDSVRVFWRDEITAIANLLMASLVWFYHWRAAEFVSADTEY